MVEHVQRHVNRYFEPTKNEQTAGIEAYFPDANISPAELLETVQTIYTRWKNGMEDLIISKDQHINMHSSIIWSNIPVII